MDSPDSPCTQINVHYIKFIHCIMIYVLIPIKTASSLLSSIRVLLSEELNLLIELISTRIQFHLNKIAINKTREVERFIT